MFDLMEGGGGIPPLKPLNPQVFIDPTGWVKNSQKYIADELIPSPSGFTTNRVLHNVYTVKLWPCLRFRACGSGGSRIGLMGISPPPVQSQTPQFQAQPTTV